MSKRQMIKLFIKPTILFFSIGALLLTASCSARQYIPPQNSNPVEDVSEAALKPRASEALDEQNYALLAAAIPRSEIDLSIPKTFNITRPKDTFTTTNDKYFATGTSDPLIPLYFDGEEIERLGTKGCFGVLLDLELGENKFSFSQDEETKTVTIIRQEPLEEEIIPITDIKQDSMVPSVFSGVKAGGRLELGCIAPSGARITAEFEGKTVALKQTHDTSKDGVPAFYKAKLEISGKYEASVTQNLGKVKYYMEYDGASAQYESNGDVYVAGDKSNIAARVKDYMGFVYENTNDLSVFREKLKRGASDYLRLEDNDSSYALLSSGGYVLREQLEVITDKVVIGNKLSKVKSDYSEKGESYSFNCPNKPAYKTSLADDKFSVTFFNTRGSPKINISKSALFSEIEVTKGENFTTYAFILKDGKDIWGYNLSYGEKNVTLSFKYKPVLSEGAKPLSGVTIVVDPGHGGDDTGAPGIAQLTGPVESDVNLAHAYAISDALSLMGAKVILARSDDTFHSLEERLEAPEKYDADLFVSVHHNSIGETVDANQVEGLEIYFHTDLSKDFAKTLMLHISNELERKDRIVNQSYYRVTLSPYSPAVLLELGFMSNPLEYERAAEQDEIDKASKAVADGIRRGILY